SPAKRYSIAALFHLLQQQPGTCAVSSMRQALERLPASGGIYRHCGQKLAKLACRTGIEPAIGAFGQSRDLAVGAFGSGIAAFLEQEPGNAEQAALAGACSDIVDALLHGIANIDRRVDALLLRLALDMSQNSADLRVAAPATDRGHQARECFGIRHPFR